MKFDQWRAWVVKSWTSSKVYNLTIAVVPVPNVVGGTVLQAFYRALCNHQHPFSITLGCYTFHEILGNHSICILFIMLSISCFLLFMLNMKQLLFRLWYILFSRIISKCILYSIHLYCFFTLKCSLATSLIVLKSMKISWSISAMPKCEVKGKTWKNLIL